MILEEVIPPTVADMRRASGIAKKAVRDWKNYCKACRKRFSVVRDIAFERFDGFMRGKTILDWGSATGGVAILMQEEFSVEMHAADVDAHSIAWLRKTNPDIHCATLTPGEVLPYCGDMFDCIYGISVLTHIPPDLQDFYLGELRRVSKEDGLVILTVKGYKACEANRLQGKNPALHPHDCDELRRKGIIFSSYSKAVLGSMEFAEKGAYGITYHSREYVEDTFGRYFEVNAINEGGWANQDVVVLKPRKSA